MKKTWWTDKLSFAKKSLRQSGDEEFVDMKNKQRDERRQVDGCEGATKLCCS